ncbi:MAG: hypothetical protein JAZ02_06095 [Candidatus Thiodiazotropha endolucinida]|nr:hypothetical protein [Candidatus Thiodiazotropha endolucinida]
MKAEDSILSLDSVQATLGEPHPAAVWAKQAPLDPTQVDCVTAVILKILDHKCKMGAEEKLALMAVYGVVRKHEGLLFDESVHETIAQAQMKPTSVVAKRIHELRLQAESQIPKPVMKYFKQYLRKSLFSVKWSV